MRDRIQARYWVLRVQIAVIPWRVRRAVTIWAWHRIVFPLYDRMIRRIGKMVMNGQAYQQDFVVKTREMPVIVDDDRYSGQRRHVR